MGTHFSVPMRPKARKAHKCIACLHTIAAGETHVMQSGHYDGRAFRNRYHDECWEALLESGEQEFTPGEFDAPERLQLQPNT